MTTFYMRPGGNDLSDGLSYANAWKTYFGGPTALRTAPGDVIRLERTLGWQSVGACTWTNGQRYIDVPAGTVKLIDAMNATAGWVASANVTLTTTTTRILEANALSFAFAAGFTTGKVAYKPTGTLDLSTFQQICMYARVSTNGVIGRYRLALCSDVLGAVVIWSAPINMRGSSTQWSIIAEDRGSALPANVESIAIYADDDPGTETLIVDNIWAAKAPGAADELSGVCVVSKSNADLPTLDSEPQYLVAGPITDTRVVLWMTQIASLPVDTAGRTYDGTTQTVATYTQRCWDITLDTGAFPVATNITLGESGTDGLPIEYAGGYNATDMSTRTGMTYQMSRVIGGAEVGTNKAYIKFSRLAYISCLGTSSAAMFQSGGNSGEIEDCITVNKSINQSATPVYGTVVNALSMFLGAVASAFGILGVVGGRIKDLYVYGLGIAVGNDCGSLTNITVRNGATSGVSFANASCSGGITICNLVTKNNGQALSVTTPGTARIVGATLNEATEVTSSGNTTRGIVSIEDKDGVVGNNVCFISNRGRLTRQTAVVDTQPSSLMVEAISASLDSYYPLQWVVWRGPITLGETTTITVRMRRNDLGLSLGLQYLPVEGLPGEDDEVRSIFAGAVDTWGDCTIVLAPTGTGVRVVSFYAIAYGGTTFLGYVERITVAVS